MERGPSGRQEGPKGARHWTEAGWIETMVAVVVLAAVVALFFEFAGAGPTT
jgi:hypothetical protein